MYWLLKKNTGGEMIEARIIKISDGCRRYIPQVKAADWKEFSNYYHAWYWPRYCDDPKRCFTKFGAKYFLKRRAKEAFGDQVVWEGEINE